MVDAYKCAICGGEYDKVISDEEAQAEFERDFPGDAEPQIVLCDPCYEEGKRRQALWAHHRGRMQADPNYARVYKSLTREEVMQIVFGKKHHS